MFVRLFVIIMITIWPMASQAQLLKFNLLGHIFPLLDEHSDHFDGWFTFDSELTQIIDSNFSSGLSQYKFEDGTWDKPDLSYNENLSQVELSLAFTSAPEKKKKLYASFNFEFANSAGDESHFDFAQYHIAEFPSYMSFSYNDKTALAELWDSDFELIKSEVPVTASWLIALLLLPLSAQKRRRENLKSKHG